MIAAKQGSTDAVKALIDAVADLHAKDNEGKTALDYAHSKEIQQILREADTHSKEIQQILRETGAK